jgi:predicted protein tyrosine phosphatase
MQLLFICSRNRWRSLTAEHLFDGVNGHAVRSAGTAQSARVKVTAGLLGWADVVFVMEKKHLEQLQRWFGAAVAGKRVVCLRVPDDYQYMDAELQEVLRARVADHGDWFAADDEQGC